MSENSDKPNPATPKRRNEAREEGQFPKARDTTAIAAMGGVLAVVVAGHGSLVELMDTAFKRTHGDLEAITRGDGGLIMQSAPMALLAVAGPPAVAAALSALAIGLWQSGFQLYPKMLKPDLAKMNPIKKLGSLLNPKNALFELALSTMRVGIVGYVCYGSLAEDIPSLLALTGAPIGPAISVTAWMLLKMTLKALCVLVFLAIVDYAYNAYKQEKEMRMSDQEVKEEMRQYDQDPKIKGKIRGKMREASQKRVLAAVADADAVVTNPTHVAVALRYAEDDPAPIVVAKGHDVLALRIRAEARKHSIPIIENRKLARALDAEVELGGLVPGQHYVAVAKVLAFVFKLQGGQRRTRRNRAA